MTQLDISGGRVVELLQRLIRTPSLPGEEGELAALVLAEMASLGYTETRIDEVGNVIGRIAGRGAAPPLMFNTHLDHVDVGDPATWPHPPYGGEIHDGKITGRGALDIKGPLAAQVIAGGILLAGEPPPGDVWVTTVVQEEVGGVGARHLARELRTPVVIVGEPSGNQIRRGHRGRTELLLRIRGRSAHASVPHRGINPLVSLGRFLSALDDIVHRDHPELGPSTVAPTLIATDQTSANVIPAEATLVCDWRNVPGESADDARREIERVARATADPAVRVSVEVPVYPRRTHTGLVVPIPADNPAYVLATSHPAIAAAIDIASATLGRAVPVGIWKFATDGGHFAEAGMAPVGFGPGDETLAHTVDEHIDIAELEEAVRVNVQLARELPSRVASG